VEPLLDKVRDVRWRFLSGGNRVDAWPPGERRSALPEAVILELELADHGTLTRFIALR
jgi:type II secretion system protein J